MSSVNSDPSIDLENIIKDFTSLVEKPSDSDPKGASNNKNLWYSWRFLQIYSTWGLRLPHTAATLKMKLGITDPGEYPFFPVMIEGYHEIHDACKNFLSNIFPNVIDIGQNLLNFASNAAPEDGDIFNVLSEMIDDNDIEGALELIGDLRDSIQTNAKKAGEVKTSLSNYKAILESAQQKVVKAKELVDEDKNLSQDQIKKMTGGPEVEGSLQKLQEMLNSEQAKHDRSVAIAGASGGATLFSMVVYPLGPIAAITVAGIFGDKAVKAMKAVQDLEDEIKKTNLKLSIAVETNRVSDSASTCLAQTKEYTALAINHTTTVQNAWKNVDSGLEVIAQKVKDMTKEKDQQVVLKQKVLVKSYANIARKKWAELVPSLKELTHDPYIVVESDEKSLGDFAKDVEKEITKLAA